MQDGKHYYAAAALAPKVTGSSVPLVVVIRGKDFSTNLLAVNGIAKTFTNLKPLGRMPDVATFALNCVLNSG